MSMNPCGRTSGPCGSRSNTPHPSYRRVRIGKIEAVPVGEKARPLPVTRPASRGLSSRVDTQAVQDAVRQRERHIAPCSTPRSSHRDAAPVVESHAAVLFLRRRQAGVTDSPCRGRTGDGTPALHGGHGPPALVWGDRRGSFRRRPVARPAAGVIVPVKAISVDVDHHRACSSTHHRGLADRTGRGVEHLEAGVSMAAGISLLRCARRGRAQLAAWFGRYPVIVSMFDPFQSISIPFPPPPPFPDPFHSIPFVHSIPFHSIPQAAANEARATHCSPPVFESERCANAEPVLPRGPMVIPPRYARQTTAR